MIQTMKHIGGLVALCSLLACCALHAEEAEFKMYPILTSETAALIEVAHAVVGEQGKVVHSKAGGRLMIMATAAQHEQIAALFSDINVPSPNVRIDIEIDSVERQKNSGVGVSAGGDVRVTPQGTRYKVDIKPHLKNRSTRNDARTVQSLMVQSGREATLQVGTETPHLEWIVSHGRHHGWIEANLVFERAGAFLRFKPTVLGDGQQIQVEVTPELRGVQKGRQVSVPFMELSTRFTVQSGQTISLGGLSNTSEFYERFLVGVDRSGASKTLSIRATPTIVKTLE